MKTLQQYKSEMAEKRADYAAQILAQLPKEGRKPDSAAKLALHAADELILALFLEVVPPLEWGRGEKTWNCFAWIHPDLSEFAIGKNLQEVHAGHSYFDAQKLFVLITITHQRSSNSRDIAILGQFNTIDEAKQAAHEYWLKLHGV